MSRNYYCLVAGLRDYAIDSQVKGFDVREIRDEIAEQLTDSDRRNMTALYEFYDTENLVNAMAGKSAFNAMGNLSREQLEQGVEDPTLLPPHFAKILKGYADAKREDIDPDELTVDPQQPVEAALWQMFYERQSKSKCSFIRNWNDFDRNVRNIAAAFTARKQVRQVASVVVGSGDVVDMLVRSSASDFGLRGELEYVEDLIQIIDIPNIIEKERKLDLLRWNMSEDLIPFDYFNINKILSYMVKLNIIQRWMTLDKEQGQQMFARLMNELKASELVDQKTDDATQK